MQRALGACILFIAAGCGGKASSLPDAALTDAALTPPCPATPAGACGLEGAECEYGSDPLAACNQLFTCSGGLLHPESGAPAGCPTPDAGVSSECPAYPPTPPASDAGASCQVHLVCDYPEGRCECEFDFSSQQIQFSCAVPSAGCPAVRPRLGTSCAEESKSCSYSVCGVLPDFGAVKCSMGIWVMDVAGDFSPCPQ